MWVLLPLLLFAGLLALLAMRGLRPSRLTLNVWSSLLLMVYLIGTAGLGLFWVANQQLPVFDWHYLFGYATLLLLGLHLALNFRVVWQHLRRRRARPVDEPVAAATSTRRGAIGLISGSGVAASSGASRALSWLGVGAVSGLAFALGLRQGRTELRIDGAAGGIDAAVTSLAVVRRFHEFSSHSRAGLLRRAPGVDWGEAPPPFKPQRAGSALGLLLLPLPAAQGGAPLNRAAGRFDIGALGELLWHTAGVSLKRGGIAFRTSPSSGALFSTELYVALRSVPGVEPGLWHYDPQRHALQKLRTGVLSAAQLGLDEAADGSMAAVLATALFRRSGHKYRDRTYRYVLADLGHALENLRVATAALGARASLQTQFDETLAAAALGVDQAEEGVLACALLVSADPSVPAQPVRPPVRSAARWLPPPLAAAGAVPLGLTDAMHRATSLRAVARGATAAQGPASAAAAMPMRPNAAPRSAGADVLPLIAARRSVRRFAITPLRRQDLAAVLAAMVEVAPLLSDALRIDVLTLAVDGLRNGAWRHDAATQELRLRAAHPEGLRARARAAALDQDVVGDAAAVLVLSASVAAFEADPAGAARGYRHALLEAGLMGERIYLEAGALGLGVCAVGAFYDEEIAALAGLDAEREWVLHLAALGPRA